MVGSCETDRIDNRPLVRPRMAVYEKGEKNGRYPVTCHDDGSYTALIEGRPETVAPNQDKSRRGSYVLLHTSVSKMPEYESPFFVRRAGP